MPRKEPVRWANVTQKDEVALGTLASDAIIAATLGLTFTEPWHSIKMRFGAIYWGGQSSGEGPLMVGVSNASISSAQILEALLVDPVESRADDQILAARMRNIAVLGILDIGQYSQQISVKDIKDVETNFRVPDGSDLKLWVVNLGPGALTTGSTVYIWGQHLGKWLD